MPRTAREVEIQSDAHCLAYAAQLIDDGLHWEGTIEDRDFWASVTKKLYYYAYISMLAQTETGEITNQGIVPYSLDYASTSIESYVELNERLTQDKLKISDFFKPNTILAVDELRVVVSGKKRKNLSTNKMEKSLPRTPSNSFIKQQAIVQFLEEVHIPFRLEENDEEYSIIIHNPTTGEESSVAVMHRPLNNDLARDVPEVAPENREALAVAAHRHGVTVTETNPTSETLWARASSALEQAVEMNLMEQVEVVEDEIDEGVDDNF